MGSHITKGGRLPRFQSLRAAYDAAFRQWVWQVGRLQSLTAAAHPEAAAVEEARRRVAQAEAAYRQSRNLLAEFLIDSQSPNHNPSTGAATARVPEFAGRRAATVSGASKSQVERLARMLWETAGRPADSADADWYLAEQLITRTRQGPTV
jgi:hypothetical protein